jgi:hypothetical protein
MEFEVMVDNKKNRELIKGACNFFARRLKIRHKPYGIILMPVDKLHKELEIDGMIAEPEPQVFVLAFDSSHRLGAQLQCIAHEFVHAKQLISGKLVYDRWRNNAALFWNGIDLTHLPHHRRPWEIEAMSKEVVLTHQFFGKMKEVADGLEARLGEQNDAVLAAKPK